MEPTESGGEQSRPAESYEGESEQEELLRDLAERREPIVLDPRTQQVLGTISSFSWEEYYSGPLPTPRQLDEYNRVSAGLGDRIVTEWQTEGSHRRIMERTALRGQLRAQSRGQVFALVIALAVIGGGLALLFTGRQAGGLVAILAPLATLAGVFIYNQRRPSVTNADLESDPDSTEHVQRASAQRETE